ncbi:flagellar basal-body rod protein FlgG [Citromicrobium bathyomarinum]|jgi:flagellar basal-body rod protein FlgG|uniref:Flagellar basal-body rod protein FlgG n=1 Tax=Alteriqipengyuania abyssalis TaxID=2860200 RepID=A0ABS7PFN4_9SPHN|nr:MULTISPECIES: flagellar basal-body rod protein FlgG [Sphingomonadales]MEC8180184.1 flagellar basal-body rod protein FlgG [Pseudomonadota bacterium]ALG60246.1 flagellar basal body rod protein FlgG [Citromicrobium sp. JL477]KPM18914.1 flagellar basal body rod protein FlgG [Citromicrobium sp. JL1351]KPM20628.1 flagellar basal body rod protein FlgG [Citromicrobium sp. JL31]KPM29902.1 flagellar basal body rod protein FlgG [Citromicrobium sp. JL2201]
MRSLSIAGTGMLAQQTNVDVISNNIANMNTTGFKRQRAQFQDLLYQQVSRPGASSAGPEARAPTGIQIGAGVRTGGVYRIAEQGALVQTDNRFDLAIQGLGYFQVQMPTGEIGYTRDGTFQLSDQGELVTSQGLVVEPGITIPQGAVDVAVSRTGEVQIKIAGETEMQTVGQIELATFVNEAGLEAKGDNLFLATAASGEPTIAAPGEPGFGSVAQGFVEASNVNPVAEITALITAQRAYEMNSRVVKTADEMLGTTSQLR